MYKFTEAELFSLLAMNIFQYREGIRTKEALIETCRILKDELGVAVGFCIVIKAILNDTFKESLEDMLFYNDDPTNSTHQLLEALYRADLSKEEILSNTADALILEALKLHDGDKESLCDMLHILTDKIEQIGELQS